MKKWKSNLAVMLTAMLFCMSIPTNSIVAWAKVSKLETQSMTQSVATASNCEEENIEEENGELEESFEVCYTVATSSEYNLEEKKVVSPSLSKSLIVSDPLDDLILKGIGILAESVLSTSVEFGTNKVLETLFGGDESSQQILAKLDEVLANQQKMIQEINAVEKMITDTQLQGVINDFLVAHNEDTVYKNYAQTMAAVQKNTELTEEQRKEKMIAALTAGMSADEKSSGVAPIDQYCQKIYALLTTEYIYTLTDKQSHSGDLLQLYRDYMRERYLFEHQADEVLKDFQDYVVGYYMNVAAIEYLSLEARLQYCQEHSLDTESVESRIKELHAQLSGSTDPGFEEKGIEKTLEEQRPSEKPYRYFWVPGHEIKLMPVAITHQRPIDTYSYHYLTADNERHAVLNELGGWKFTKSKGFSGKVLTESFWSPFWQYNYDGTDCELLSSSDYASILEGAKGYNDFGNLRTMLFSKTVGNLSLDDAGHYHKDSRFLFKRTDADHPFYIKTHGYGIDHDYELIGYGIGNVDTYAPSAIELGRYMEEWDFKKYSYYAIHYTPTIVHGDWGTQGKDTWYMLVAKYNEPNGDNYIDDEFSYDFSNDPDPVIPSNNSNEDNDNPGYYSSGTTNDIPANAVVGSWSRAADGSWSFADAAGQPCRNCWAYIYNPYAKEGQAKASWFRFDAEGKMLTGWFDAADGNRYYLNPLSDNCMGAMLTGWQSIDNQQYYFETAEGAVQGALYRSRRTPDGFLVDAAGIRVGR